MIHLIHGKAPTSRDGKETDDELSKKALAQIWLSGANNGIEHKNKLPGNHTGELFKMDKMSILSFARFFIVPGQGSSFLALCR